MSSKSKASATPSQTPKQESSFLAIGRYLGAVARRMFCDQRQVHLDGKPQVDSYGWFGPMSKTSDRFLTALALSVGGTLFAGGAGVAGVPSPAAIASAVVPPAQAAPSDSWQWPVTDTVTAPFNEQREGHKHGGIDFGSATGTDIHAAHGGKVTTADGTSDPNGFGNLVIIDAGDGLTVWYGHLSVIGVKVGQEVQSNEVIGQTGDSGRSTGPHLHFEIRRKNKPVDPHGIVKPADKAATATCTSKVSREKAHACWDGLINKYDWDDTTAFNIMYCESTGYPDAYNPEPVKLPDGSKKNAIGLFQVLGGPKDPEANVKLAYEMYTARKWQPWECKG